MRRLFLATVATALMAAPAFAQTGEPRNAPDVILVVPESQPAPNAVIQQPMPQQQGLQQGPAMRDQTATVPSGEYGIEGCQPGDTRITCRQESLINPPSNEGDPAETYTPGFGGGQ